MAEKNYYDILGIKKDASDADIKKKYRKLVRQYHPDVSDDPDADNKIAEINNAYETLRDKDKRSEYDAMLDNPFAGQAGAGGFGGFGGQSAGAQGGFRWEDIKDQFGDGEAFGGGGDGRAARPHLRWYWLCPVCGVKSQVRVARESIAA